MKRSIVTLTLVIVFTLSATAFAILPTQHTSPAPADGDTIAALTFFDVHVMAEGCPGPDDTGCSGG